MINPLYQELIDIFPFEPTHEQMVAMNRLATFVSDPAGRKVFLLKGYAGTGKTLIISTLVQTLARHHKRVVLMAPTGRAAKVFQIHRVFRRAPSIKRFTVRNLCLMPAVSSWIGICMNTPCSWLMRRQ